MTNPKFPPSDLFGEILASLLDETGIFPNRVLWADYLGVNPASISRWVTNIPHNLMSPRYFASLFNYVEDQAPSSQALEFFWKHARDAPAKVAPDRKLNITLVRFLVLGEQQDLMARLTKRLALENPSRQLELLRHWRKDYVF